MKITSLAAAFAAALTLAACSAAPTGPAPSSSASFDVTNTVSLSGGLIAGDSTAVSTSTCNVIVLTAPTTTTSTTTSGTVSAQGTYAVAYGSTTFPVCTATP